MKDMDTSAWEPDAKRIYMEMTLADWWYGAYVRGAESARNKRLVDALETVLGFLKGAPTRDRPI